MINQNNIEANVAATYLENYFNCIESLSDDVQRYISEIRRLDAHYFDGLTKIQGLRAEYQQVCHLAKAISAESLTGNSEKNSIIEKKRFILKRLKQLLVEGQMLSDEKLKQVSTLTEIMEHKWTQLEFDAKSLDMDHSDISLGRSQSNGLSMNLRVSPQHHSFKSPDDSINISSISVTLRSERRLAVVDESSESQPVSSSQSSSISNLKQSVQSSASHHKRTRRQKQFPDFVRDADIGGCDGQPTRKEKTAVTSTAATAAAAAAANPVSTTSNIINKRRRKAQSQSNEISSGANGSTNNKTSRFTLPVEPDEPTYCLCDQVSYGEMIGCDNTECEIEWFHFNCVGLTGKPKGKWFCPNCRGDRQNVMKD